MEGIILKGNGGLYTVESSGELYSCTARGVFRKRKITPLPGDRVAFTATGPEGGSIEEIFPRKNFLIRPAAANLDRLFVVSSAKDPAPNPLIIDKTIAAAELKGIEPVAVFTKTDLGFPTELEEAYRKAGILTAAVSSVTGEGVERIRELLRGAFSAFTGNSGVGKSTLLNRLFPELQLDTGEISRKLGRGRHTTRCVELYPLEGGGYVADTPGFSSLEMERYEILEKEQLAFGFREFVPYLTQCRFSTCSHTCEKGCAVLEALARGEIAASRWESYKIMYDEVKDIKQWQIPKNV